MAIQLVVYCRRGSVTKDAGVHATYPDIGTAEIKAPDEIAWLRKFYDDVSFRFEEETEDRST